MIGWPNPNLKPRSTRYKWLGGQLAEQGLFIIHATPRVNFSAHLPYYNHTCNQSYSFGLLARWSASQ